MTFTATRHVSLEFLIARDLPRRVYRLFIGDGELLADFPLESPEFAARQEAFIVKITVLARQPICPSSEAEDHV